MKQFTLKLACLLCILLFGGGSLSAQTVTYEAKPISSTNEITTGDGSYYAFMIVDTHNKYNIKTGQVVFPLNSQITVHASYKMDNYLENDICFFSLEASTDGYKIKNKSTEKYWYLTDRSSNYHKVKEIEASSAEEFTLTKLESTYIKDGVTLSTFSIGHHDSGEKITVTGTSANNIGYKVGNDFDSKFYFVIYKITEKAATPTASFYFYNADGSTKYNAEALTFDVTEEKNTIKAFTQSIIPNYVTATYYSDESFSTEVTDLTKEITETSTFYVKTAYKEGVPFPTTSTEYCALKCPYTTDATNFTYYYLNSAGKAISSPTYEERGKLAMTLSGDWYNGFTIKNANNEYVYYNGTNVYYSTTNSYNWKIDNNYYITTADGRYLQLMYDNSFGTNSNSMMATRFASAEAADAIKNSAPEGYVGSLDKSQAGSITFDDLIKDNFTKLALEVGKYYFIETANDPTNAISSAEAACNYGQSDLTSGAQKIKASHSFPELWKYADNNKFINANTGYYLSRSGNLSTKNPSYANKWKTEASSNDETVFQLKEATYTYNNYYLEIFNSEDVKATNTTTSFKGWRFRLAESIDIKMTAKDGKSYATTCAPVAVTLSESDAANTTLFIEKSHTENMISLGKAEAVAANTGIYIENTNADASITLLFTESGSTSEATSPILAGTNVQLTLPTDRTKYRTLGFNSKDQIGFFKPASTIAAIPANRAFLYLSGSSLTNAFYIDLDGTTTSIDELLPDVDVLNTNAPIYDLSGRRMEGTLHKGIYIQNGRKFMVK